MRPKVLATHWLQPEAASFLREFADLDMPSDGEVFSPAEIRARGREADALMVCMADLVDASLLDACPRIRVVAAAVKGGNNIDVIECTRRGIWVTVCPDLLTAPTAELVVGMMIALGRRLNQAQRSLRDGFHGWRPRLFGPGLAGRTTGLVGMGRLGRAVARRLSGFEMTLLYHDPQALSATEELSLGVARRELDELLSQSDYVVLLAPLTAATRHLIDRLRLSAMQPEAMLINCARGSIVDEAAVAAALGSGRLAGYAADVFAMEDWSLPGCPSAIDPGLLEQPDRVVLTPHIGSAVDEFRQRISMATAEQIKAVFEGQRPDLAINDLHLGDKG